MLRSLVGSEMCIRDRYALSIVSGQEWAAGEEVFINYGPEGNDRLLTIYGFCCNDNPYDRVKIWATASPSIAEYERKNMLLQENDVQDNLPFELSLADPLPNKLLGAMRVQRATDDEMEAAMVRAFEDEPLTKRNEIAVLDGLREALGMMQYRYPTSIEDDVALLFNNSEHVTPNNMAVVLRLSEKRILEAAIHQITVRKTQVEESGGCGEN
eukprot:TRINITY_DN12409_c0_g1_i1.p1 TRINITY_DN12409_c0_g1~~TRINITY_DN12409_c0_g1_i1.p1  ORF type:complete len:247 (+),score=66.16 TRINITY_DN12409_c0_g1_i1:107-742(+)